MTSTWKPEGHTSVSPYLITDQPQAVIDFLGAALEAPLLRRFEREDGSVMHAEVRVDDSVVMIGGTAEGFEAVPAHVHVYVPDVDRTYELALANGGQSVQEPQQMDDLDRRCGVRDPGGTTWWFSTTVVG